MGQIHRQLGQRSRFPVGLVLYQARWPLGEVWLDSESRSRRRFPSRSVEVEAKWAKVSESGVYFTNCEHVSFGYFGSVEIVSKNAVGNLLANLDTCKNNPEINNKTFGEDLFAQKCMNSVGVSNIEDFYVVTDGVCDAIAVAAATKAKKKVVHLPDCTMGTAAFHPLKTVPAYLKCLSAAQQHQR